MSSDPLPNDDPRPKRALILGGALLGAVLLYNADWWSSDSPVIITMDNDDRAAARDEIRQVAHDVRDGVRETLAETRDEADVEAADEETETGDTRGVSIERNGEGATRITIGAGE